MQVTIYSKPDCPFCKKAKDLLHMLNMNYVELVKDVDFDGFAYKDRMWPTYPCVVVDGEVIGGYQEFANWTVDNNKFG